MRKNLFTIHYYLALIAMVPLLLITLTGSLLVFKFEIDSLLMPDAVTLPHEEAVKAGSLSRHSLDSSMAAINKAYPNYEIGSWEIFDDGYEADRVYLIKKGGHTWYKAYFNPFTNQPLSEPVLLNSDLTDWLLELHYTLLLNDLFKAYPHMGVIVGLIAAIILTVLGITGLILYRNFWKKFFSLKWSPKPVVFTRRLHRLFGIWSSPVLLIVGLTGIYFNLVVFLEEKEEHAEGEHIMAERLYNDQVDFQRLLDDSRQQIDGFTPTYILFPTKPKGSWTVFGHTPTSNFLASSYGSTVTYNPQDGTHTSNYELPKQHFGWVLIDTFRKLHFGHFGGLASKLVWFIGGLAIAFLGFSGLYTWYKRVTARRKKRRRVRQRAAA